MGGCCYSKESRASLNTSPSRNQSESRQSLNESRQSLNTEVNSEREEKLSIIRRISTTITTFVISSSLSNSISTISTNTRKSYISERQGSERQVSERQGSEQSTTNILTSKVIIRNDNNMEIFANDLVNESRRIFRIYSGIDKVQGINFQWNIRSKSNNIIVSAANVINSKYLVIKSTSRCHADKYTITNLLYDVTRVSEYEDNIEGYEILYDDYQNNCSIRRFRYKKISPVSARDAVVITTWTELNDDIGSILITTLSVPTLWYPPPKSFVRAFVHSSGAIIRPINDNIGGGCEITFLTHCDVGGYVPSTLLNMIIVNTPVKTMSKVVSLSENDMMKK